MAGSTGTDVRRPAARRSPAGTGGRAPFVAARARFAPLLPASMLLMVVTAATVTTALASFSARALPAAVHERLSAVPETILITGQMGAARADADLRVIRSAIGSALRPAGLSVLSGRWSDQLALPGLHGSGQLQLIQAAALDRAGEHVVLTAGAWPGPYAPGKPVGVVVPARSAALLGLGVGRVLELRDNLTGAMVRLRVAGLFRPRDPQAPYWRLSLLGESGRVELGSFVTYGPMLVRPDAFAAGGLGTSNASWLITVRTGHVPPGDLTSMAGRLAAAVGSLQARSDLGGVQVTTSLPQRLAALGVSLVVSRSLLLIGSLLLVVLAAAAAALAARLLTDQRAEEEALLSARGGARGQLARAAVVEACLLAAVGTVTGLVAGCYLGSVLMSVSHLPAGPGGVLAPLRDGLADGAWRPAVAVAALVVAVMVWPALRPVTPGAARAGRSRQAAVATAVRAGLDVALIGLGAVAVWELRRYSAVGQLAGGRLGIDPVLALAPALAIMGMALLPLRLLPGAARWSEQLSSRGRRLIAPLANWHVGRSPLRQGGPILMVVLAAGTGTLLLGQHQSWRQSQLDRAAFAAGADVRVSLAAPLPAGQAGLLRRLSGVRAAMPVGTFPSGGFEGYAVDARLAARTVLLRSDLALAPPAELWSLITPRRAGQGLVLPGQPARLAITAMLQPPPRDRIGQLQASLVVQDGSGIGYSLPAGSLPTDGRPHRLVADLGPGGRARYPLRLLAVSLSYKLPGFPPAPYRDQAARLAAIRVEARAATGRAVLTMSELAISGKAATGYTVVPGWYRAVGRWGATAAAPDLANTHSAGTRPAIASWRAGTGIASMTFTVGSGHFIPKAGLPPLPITGQVAVSAGLPPGPLPALATRSFLRAAGAHLGGDVLVPVGGATVLVRFVAQLRAFPTAGGSGAAVVIDLGWLERTLASQLQAPLPVTQWWLSTAHGVPRGLPAGATTITRSGTTGSLLSDPLAGVPQLGLLLVVAAALMLAGAGLVVSVVGTVAERRVQDALLAALGMGRAARTGQLCLEQLIITVPAAGGGVLIGALLAHVLVPSVTLTAAAAAPFPPVRVVVPAGWTVLLAAAIAVAPVLAAIVATWTRPDPAARLRAGDAG